MKTPFLITILITALTLPAAAKGLAAKEALRTLARERGASWLERVVQINGDRGQDQPNAWHIVASDGKGGLREFFVGTKGLLGEGPVPASVIPQLQGPQVTPKKFTVDSTNAFMKANAAAKKARIGFDSASYRLRAATSGASVWYLQLNNAAGQKVGEATVSASSGRVTQMLAFTPPPPAPPQTAGQATLDKTREVVKTGTQSVGRGINRAGQWISRKFSPQPEPAPYYTPPAGR